MNKNQLKNYRMFLAVQNTLDHNTTTWCGNPKFTETKKMLDIEIDGIEILGEEASKTTKGMTRDKNMIRSALEKKSIALAGTMSAHASITENETLKSILITSKGALENKKETDLVVYSKTLTKHAESIQKVLMSEYGVTSSEIEDVNTTIAEFQPLIGNAKPEQSAINAAKRDIDDHIKQGKFLLKDVLDKLMIRYQFTDITFYNEYQQSRTIVDV
ncbi:hypothetical protein U6A24_19385 [Aquimarina gracilis]|uniref:Uncharacterized protein n=1 Tax=Aquimarina gracilis TaxID=874422 RepID=A0ABU6A0H3_9FLAO|nr:hypothetical protein [Aquimarina gracilis]MEB3347649.1 hypothetical protein [Aquimarina gracilis]